MLFAAPFSPGQEHTLDHFPSRYNPAVNELVLNAEAQVIRVAESC